MTQSIFTSLNTSAFVNDSVLNGVFQVSVSEGTDNSTYIRIKRHVLGNDYLVNTMRAEKFSFRLINSATSGGYVTEIAELDQFEMELGVKSDGSEMLLEQTLVVKTLSFFYHEDARSTAMKTVEKDDINNLINIIKENQAKTQVNRAILPTEDVDVKDEDLVWLNANDPEQVKDTKPRKLKKNKKGK
jgi:hypothetical protein